MPAPVAQVLVDYEPLAVDVRVDPVPVAPPVCAGSLWAAEVEGVLAVLGAVEVVPPAPALAHAVDAELVAAPVLRSVLAADPLPAPVLPGVLVVPAVVVPAALVADPALVVLVVPPSFVVPLLPVPAPTAPAAPVLVVQEAGGELDAVVEALCARLAGAEKTGVAVAVPPVRACASLLALCSRPVGTAAGAPCAAGALEPAPFVGAAGACAGADAAARGVCVTVGAEEEAAGPPVVRTTAGVAVAWADAGGGAAGRASCWCGCRC